MVFITYCVPYQHSGNTPSNTLRAIHQPLRHSHVTCKSHSGYRRTSPTLLPGMLLFFLLIRDSIYYYSFQTKTIERINQMKNLALVSKCRTCTTTHESIIRQQFNANAICIHPCGECAERLIVVLFTFKPSLLW